MKSAWKHRQPVKQIDLAAFATLLRHLTPEQRERVRREIQRLTKRRH